MGNQMVYQGVILVAFIAIMYFMLIKPQKKREKEVDDMRNSVRTGDEVVTIGGIMGRILKVKDDSVIIQVGADKTKFEIKKWAISSVEKKGSGYSKDADDSQAEEARDSKKSKPKRLGKKTAESMEEELKAASEDVSEAVETSQAVEEAAEEMVE